MTRWRPPPRPSRDGGFALLIVLWSLVLLAFLGTRLALTTRSEIQIAGNVRTQAVREALADGAVYDAAYHLLATGADHWDADGSSHATAAAGTRTIVAVTDEATKVNVNTAPPELLAALLLALGTDPDRARRLAAAIVAWRGTARTDTDQTPNAAYRSAGLAYGPPGSPFRSLAEIGLVMGMDPDLAAALRPCLTLVSTHGPLVSAATEPAVVAALRQVGGGRPRETQEADAVSVAVTLERNGRTTRHATLRFDDTMRGRVLRVLDWGP